MSKLILFKKQTKKRRNKQKGSAHFIMTLILKFESKVRNGSILMMVTFDPIRPRLFSVCVGLGGTVAFLDRDKLKT